MTSGEKIRRARRKVGLTQKKLGENLNMSQQQIAQYENGKRKAGLSTLRKIGGVLGVSEYQLGDDYEFRDTVPPGSRESKSQQEIDEEVEKFKHGYDAIKLKKRMEDSSNGERVAKKFEFKSDKGTRLSCKIDSWLYNILAEAAEGNGRTIEDEVEERLYKSVTDELNGVETPTDGK